MPSPWLWAVLSHIARLDCDWVVIDQPICFYWVRGAMLGGHLWVEPS